MNLIGPGHRNCVDERAGGKASINRVVTRDDVELMDVLYGLDTNRDAGKRFLVGQTVGKEEIRGRRLSVGRENAVALRIYGNAEYRDRRRDTGLQIEQLLVVAVDDGQLFHLAFV